MWFGQTSKPLQTPILPLNKHEKNPFPVFTSAVFHLSKSKTKQNPHWITQTKMVKMVFLLPTQRRAEGRTWIYVQELILSSCFIITTSASVTELRFSKQSWLFRNLCWGWNNNILYSNRLDGRLCACNPPAGCRSDLQKRYEPDDAMSLQMDVYSCKISDITKHFWQRFFHNQSAVSFECEG